jgi:hypothetical protein
MELYEVLNIAKGLKRVSEMAFPMKQIRQELMNSELLTKRSYHLILIYYFRKEQETKHWIGELSGFIPKSPWIKKRNRRFNADETFHYIWRGYAEDNTPEFIHSGVLSNAKIAEENKREEKERDTGKKVKSLSWDSIKQNPNDAVSFMQEFHEWAANQLAEKGEVFSSEVQQEISFLWNRHPL